MDVKQPYEVLDGLPVYGPMYIPISQSGEPFYSEGYVVRFYRKDGTDWVGNFETGFTSYSTVFLLPQSGNMVVIARVRGYIMTPEQQKPLNTFGYAITEGLLTEEGSFVVADMTNLIVIDKDSSIWETVRISWDGIKDLKMDGSIVSGLSFDPMDDVDEWVSFSVNLKTKEIQGGSYRRLYTDDGRHKKKPFWKFW